MTRFVLSGFFMVAASLVLLAGATVGPGSVPAARDVWATGMAQFTRGLSSWADGFGHSAQRAEGAGNGRTPVTPSSPRPPQPATVAQSPAAPARPVQAAAVAPPAAMVGIPPAPPAVPAVQANAAPSRLAPSPVPASAEPKLPAPAQPDRDTLQGQVHDLKAKVERSEGEIASLSAERERVRQELASLRQQQRTDAAPSPGQSPTRQAMASGVSPDTPGTGAVRPRPRRRSWAARHPARVPRVEPSGTGSGLNY
jgi:hypothetical protein